MERKDKMERKEYLEKEYNIHGLRTHLIALGGTPGNMKKSELIEEILKIESGEKEPSRSKRGRKPKSGGDDLSGASGTEVNDPRFKGMIEVCGYLRITADGYGFLYEDYNIGSQGVAFLTKNTIKKFFLREGDLVLATALNKRENGSPEVVDVFGVNGQPPANIDRPHFDELKPYYPDYRFTLGKNGDVSLRLIDIFSPIGKGQRALIVAPPKTGKTTLLKKIALSLEQNYPDVKIFILLVDERPEEVTDFKEGVKGEVVYSTFDEAPSTHVKISQNLLARAKSLVESGNDVVVLVDSITKLTRAYNAAIPSSGKTLSGGIDPQALIAPKHFFGSARKTQNGTLTIIATALIETGSRMDDVIFEEFKGTGNMEVVLSRELANRRIFPAIDLFKSGTRKEELLLSEEELDCAYKLRRLLNGDNRSIEGVLDAFEKTRSNDEIVKKIDAWLKLIKN